MLKYRKWMRFASLLTILSLLVSNVDMTAFAAEESPETEIAAQIQETEQTQETQSAYESDDNADVENVRTEDAETAVIESSVTQSSVEETVPTETTGVKAEETEPEKTETRENETETYAGEQPETPSSEMTTETEAASVGETETETVAESGTEIETETMTETEAETEIETETATEEVKVNVSENRLAFSDTDIAHGEYKEDGNDIIWVIDKDGKLTVEGTGNYSASSGEVPWYNNRASIKTAVVNVTGMTTAYSMFKDCNNLASVDLSGFDTKNVTSMKYMFDGCKKLTSLDTSAFNTENVTDMNHMFAYCESLTSLDLGSFHTENVTSMYRMFCGCTRLRSLDLSGFNTENVTFMNGMFLECKSLTSLDVSGFNTENVTDMHGMFANCESLTSLDLSGFNTENVTDMHRMFANCESLTSLDLGNFHTENVTNMGEMFFCCESLTSLDVNGFDTENVTDMYAMFHGCKKLTSLDVSGFNTENVTDMSSIFNGCESLTSLDVSGFNTENVTDMGAMFNDCKKLTSLDVSGFNTENVTDMSGMFDYCTSLTSLGVSGFNTENVTDMTEMFCFCESLTSLDVSGFNTENVMSMSLMFRDCKSLTNLDVSGFDTGNVTDMTEMFVRCESLTSLDVSGFDTENVADMGRMFGGCKKLTSLETGAFNTENVTDMSSMFDGCESLTSLDVNGFDTENVTDMSSMFYGCKKLTSLETGAFNTENVTDMSSMFYGCESLTSLDVSGFNTENVTNMQSIFYGCEKLTSLDTSVFNTENVTDMSSMFYGCESLTGLDLSSFNTGNVTSMQKMFSGCESLTSLDLSGFDMGKVRNSYSMFYSDDRDGIKDMKAIKTMYAPRNLSADQTIKLPRFGAYDLSKTFYQNLPTGLEQSILLYWCSADEITSTAYIVAKKAKTSYVCGEALETDDITVTYYSADGTVKILAQAEYRTNAAELDMSSAGKKTLTVTYTPDDAEEGVQPLTAEIVLRVGILLDTSTASVTLPAADAYSYVYDGKPKKPVPTVTYTVDGKSIVLTEKKDYTVSYRNSTNAYRNAQETPTEENVPTVIVKGCGAYTGTLTETFEIQKAAAPTLAELSKTATTGTVTRIFYFEITTPLAKYGSITGYKTGTPTEDDAISGNVLEGQVSVVSQGTFASLICKISTTAAIGDFATVPVTVSFQNYEDAVMNVKIVIKGTTSVQTKKKVKISGIEIKDSTYNKTPVSYTGTAKVISETDSTDVTGTVKLTYTYSGTQADNSAYTDTPNAPANAGSYKLTIAVSPDDKDYTGSIEYPFKITKAPLTITARDMGLKIGAPLPKQEDYLYDAAGLLTGDALTTAPALSCSITDTAKAGTYDIIASNADAGMNYEITYKNGTLTVSETGESTKYYTVTYNMNGHGNDITNTGVKEGSLLEKPQDPQEAGYTFTGWYKDQGCTALWDFERDTVQSDTTIYAGWKKKGTDNGENTSWQISEISPAVYTGSTIKPTVTVYGSDGTLLKPGTHYTIAYKNNTDADKVAAAGGTRSTESSSADGFHEELPHVIITGKGNYTGSIYKNFHIYPTSISSDGETPAKGFTLKYTEQLVTANKAQKPFTSIKYKKAMTIGKDYELEFSKYAADGSLQPITSGSTLPSIPANDTGTFRLVITGKGNYSGTVGMDIYVGGKDSLMKNARITLGKDIKNVSYTGADITPQASAENGADVFTVKFGNKYLTPETDYTVSYRNNRAAGTATIIVRGKGQYIGTKSAAFTIKGTPFKAKDAAVKNFEASKTHTGSAIEQGKDGMTIGGKTLDYGTDYSVAYKNNVKKGTATVTFRANPESGYSGSFNKTFKITAADLSSAAAEFSDYTVTGTDAERQLDKNVPYSKEGAQPAGSLRLTGVNGRTLQNGTDYTVSYANHKKTGAEAVMTIKGKGNYTGKITVKYTVGKASLVANERLAQSCTPMAFNAAKADSYLYKPKFKLTDGKKALSAKTDYKQPTDESYINCTQDKIKAYLDALESGSVTGTALEEMKPCVIIDAADNGSYTGSTKVYLTIYRTKLTKNALDVQVTGGDIYTGKQVTPTVTVRLRADGRTLAEGRDYTLSYGANTAAGRNKGSVTVTGTGLYGGSVTVKFDIKSRDINKR